MNVKKYIASVLGMAILGVSLVAVPAFAQTNQGSQNSGQSGDWGNRGPGGGRGNMVRPGVAGKVSAISGNTITITGMSGFGKATTPATTATFSVDASNAIVMKNNATSTLGSIVVGDMVFVQGTVSGTNVVATMIRDGMIMRAPGMMGKGDKMGSTTPMFEGNGEPVIAGNVSAVSGSSFSITNKSNAVYTVDASNAKINVGKNTGTVANINVGDSVLVQGVINGNAVVASSVMDQAKSPSSNASGKGGFFGGIGSFFKHLFGF